MAKPATMINLEGIGEERAKLAPWRSRPAILGGLLFVVATSLVFLVSRLYFFLYLPALLMSMRGIRELHGHRAGSSRRLASTGGVMVFNGIVLILSLFIVGFIRDFLQAHPATLDESVAVALTTVHLMLGAGLFLLDLRHLEA